MIVSLKDSAKLFGVSVMACCAVTVCHMFLNYYLDLKSITALIDGPAARMFYDAQIMTAKVICAVSGGCLAATTVVLLLFYIKHYIDGHAREIGILKALGYSGFRIARSFSVFGLSVFIGCLTGYLLSFALIPRFYELQNKDGYLPAVSVHIHGILFFLLVIVPTLFFALLAVGGSLHKLHEPCVKLLKGLEKTRGKNRDGRDGRRFLADMKSAVLRSRRTLIFFIAFASFCFSAMVQMSASMKELSSEMMGWMILVIGLVLAFTSLYIAVTSVVRSNQKNVAMLRVFGYDGADCKGAVLDGYRPAAYLGFAIGSVYQYLLLKIMVEVVFAGFEGVPDYAFDFPVFFLTLGAFVAVYEGVMLLYGQSMKKIPLKQIMSE